MQGEQQGGKPCHRVRGDSGQGSLCRKTFSGVKVETGQRDHCRGKHFHGIRMEVDREAFVLTYMFRQAYQYFLKFPEQTNSLGEVFSYSDF